MFAIYRYLRLSTLAALPLVAALAFAPAYAFQISTNPASPSGSSLAYEPVATVTVQAQRGASEPAASGSSASSRSRPLLLGAGDLLNVEVFDTPELSCKLRVDGDGGIILPIGGRVEVAGLTAEQAQSAIESQLREQDILHNPHVSVRVLEYATQGVSVIGEVKSPGVYPLQGNHDVLDLLSAAGGLTPSASQTVNLIHQSAPAELVTVNLNQSAQSLSQSDTRVLPGDKIVVTRAGVVYVLGDVGKPGGYPVENDGTITTVQALALAQGLNKTAKWTGFLIHSTPAGRTQSELPLKKILAGDAPDPQLQDGDILYVPVSGARNWGEKVVTSALQMAVGVVIYGRY